MHAKKHTEDNSESVTHELERIRKYCTVVRVLAHTQIHKTEPELFRGYNPKKKAFNQEIKLIHDLEPIEVAESEAHKFKLQHGNKCDIWAGEGGQWFFKPKKGALVLVPKSFSFSRTVAGQIPTRWHAGRYGIPDDIIAQADRATLWALCHVVGAACTYESLSDLSSLAILLNSLARASLDIKTVPSGASAVIGEGVDQELIPAVPRNFTPLEHMR
ncbi:hypothetical protein B0H13DRAFT_2444648 [Mycena leptocephala]|nr:hypothetical protein B0H13DRAFT_2444648 [Mycena leptocephala]